MAALANDRNTQRRGNGRVVANDAQLAANTTLFNGGMVGNNAGALVPASDTVGLVTLGVAPQRMSNATGATAKVTPRARVDAGFIFKLDNAAANGCDATDLGKTVYVVDDHTVGKAAATAHSIPAGILDSFDEIDGAPWVRINP